MKRPGAPTRRQLHALAGALEERIRKLESEARARDEAFTDLHQRVGLLVNRVVDLETAVDLLCQEPERIQTPEGRRAK